MGKKQSVCSFVIIQVNNNIYLHVNNEYNDSAIDLTFKYRVRINCGNFVSVDSLPVFIVKTCTSFSPTSRQVNNQKINLS